MAAVALRSEERIGLAVALVAHVALVALLLLPRTPPVAIPSDRIEVTISDDVGLTSTSPEPQAEAAPDVAPELGEPAPPVPAPPAPAPKVEPAKPQPRPEPKPQPQPKPQAKPEPPRPAPRPVASPRPAPRAAASPAPRPAAAPAKPAAAPAQSTTRPTGGSRIGSDFLKGVPGAQNPGTARNPPAQAAGPQVQASLLGAISRAIRPHWQGKVPEGADSEKLVTVLRWNLNRDGSIAGRPQVVRQEGITDANRPQAGRHAEQAIRAVELAAPFDLPDQYYDTWKRVTIRFDKRLSQ
ncbi:MAG: hypothetical protein WCY29_09950 [Novosphingobium sp.]